MCCNHCMLCCRWQYTIFSLTTFLKMDWHGVCCEVDISGNCFLVFSRRLLQICPSILCNGCNSHLFVSPSIITVLPLLVWNNLAGSVWSRLAAILKLIRPHHPGILDALLLFYLFQIFLLFASFCQTLIQKFNTCRQVLGFYFFYNFI